MGMTFDNACVLWLYDECGSEGSCLSYNNKDLALQLFIMCLSIKVISLVAMVLAGLLYKPPVTAEPSSKRSLPLANCHKETELERIRASVDGQVDDKSNGYDKIQVSANAIVFAAEDTNRLFDDHSI